MIQNYLKVAFRNLWKHKALSLINVAGLAIAMSACFLIAQYVKFEKSYDSFHLKSDRIFRVVTDIKSGERNGNIGSSWPYGPTLKADFPEIEEFVRVGQGNFLVQKGEAKFQESNVRFADSTLFKVFDFKLIKGNPLTVLKAPYSIVFSESAATKYFGDSDPIGQTVLFDRDGNPATVTGIMQDIPENSQIKADLFVSVSTLSKKNEQPIDQQWGDFEASTYILLKPQTTSKSLSEKLPDFIQNHAGKFMQENQISLTLALEPLKDIYLYSERGGAESGNAENVFVFTAVAIFIMLIACINFINLSTARAAGRAKEVGVRKVIGAGKFELAAQFISEAVLVCLFAFLLAVILAFSIIPFFNNLAGKTIVVSLFSDYVLFVILFCAAILIGLLSGIYPALVLSSLKPVKVLKGAFVHGKNSVSLRKGLVTIQFVISLTLIMATILIYVQMDYMRSKDLGFSKEPVLVLDTDGDKGKNSLNESLKTIHGVVSTSLSSNVPGNLSTVTLSEIQNKNGIFQPEMLPLYLVDFNYIPLYKMKMIAGRPFLREYGSDTTQSIIINETAAKLFGFQNVNDAVGKRFKQWGNEGEVIGVVKDFHFQSLQESVKPLTMRVLPEFSSLVSVQLSGNNLTETINQIEDQWKKLMPNRPFNYYFIDEYFNRQYHNEERFETLFFTFAVLAIFISCLGLVGLTSYSTVQRAKEIGIRKVLGATVSSIVALFLGDFLILIVISFVIAAPVSYYFMDKWLENFAYKTEIGIWIFGVAGALAVSISVITIGFQSVKAALINPVSSLKGE